MTLLNLCLTFLLVGALMMFLNPTPISLGLILLFMTTTTSLFSAFQMSTWFAMTLFLFFAGGLLVLFSYFIALTPNKTLNPRQTTPLVILIFMLILLFLSSTLNLPPHTTLTHPSAPFLTALYTPANLPLLFTITIILFLALLIVVKVTSPSSGPLRPFDNKSL